MLAPLIDASNVEMLRSAYDVFNRKLFSLPKLILLPGVIARQPMLLVKIFPIIVLTDVLKGRIVASVTDKVEQFQKEARDVNSVRQKVEQFDMKNAELVSASCTRRLGRVVRVAHWTDECFCVAFLSTVSCAGRGSAPRDSPRGGGRS